VTKAWMGLTVLTRLPPFEHAVRIDGRQFGEQAAVAYIADRVGGRLAGLLRAAARIEAGPVGDGDRAIVLVNGCGVAGGETRCVIDCVDRDGKRLHCAIIRAVVDHNIESGSAVGVGRQGVGENAVRIDG